MYYLSIVSLAPEEVASTASSVRPKRKLFREMESQVTPKDPKKMRNMALQKTPPTSRQTEMTPKSRRSTFSNTDLTLSKDVQTLIPSQNCVVKKSTSTQTVIETDNKSVQACLEKIELLKSSDKELKKFTGIENYKLFEILHKYLISKCSVSLCTIHTHSDDPSKLFSHISTESQLLLVLYKLKRNPVDSVLSSEFHISTGRISEIFKFWIKRMYRKFKIIKIWPSHENVHKHMPTATKQHFPDLVAISDCVEFSTQVPRAPLPGKQLFSNYKNCHTVKVMYSTAPNGALIHCSDAYGGNSSDKEIFAQSDLSTRLKPHDGLMVDKGFLIKDCIQGKDIKLYRPPFLTEKMKQFDTTDRESGRLIARSRIVVENFNARLSYFTFLKQKKIPVLYLPIMNEISFVCGFLANLGPLVRNTRSTETLDEQIEDEDML